MVRLALTLLLLPVAASAANVRPDRPRILIGDGKGPGTSLAQFKSRCASDPGYMARCQSSLAGGTDPMNRAAAWLVTGDASKCGDAYNALQTVAGDTPGMPDPHSFISNNGGTMLQLAATRDWCDQALSPSQSKWIEDRIALFADWYLANTGMLDVWHDDMNNVFSAVALAGLTLKGTAYDAQADGYLQKADAQWKQVIFPALAYEGDWWHEGFTYVQPSIGLLALYASAWSIATDENIYDWAKANAGDVLEGYLRFHAYAMRPDYNYVYFGDTSDNKQSIELFSRPLIDLLTIVSHSPLGQALSIEIKSNARPFYDYSGVEGYKIALLYDATLDGQATPRSSLPTARWMSQGAADIAILRSGWGKDDTFIWMSCGDYFGAHGHDEAGSFQIFRHAQLSGSTGYYDNFNSTHWYDYYSQHSVHANTLAIQAPNEFFPTGDSLGDPKLNVNDGGQRVLRRDQKGTAYNNPDLPAYLKNKMSGTKYETGDLKTFEHGICHDYVACDVTAAYDSPGFATNGNAAKVNEVTRQLVFLRPELILVFDRIESTDASYEKRFLLHGLAAPAVAGQSFSITNGGTNGSGRLFGQTLLPAAAKIATVTNFTVAGMSYPPNPAGNESGGTRLEISPAAPATRDYFLHLFDATDPTRQAGPSASVVEDGQSATVTVDDGTQIYTVSFAKVGPLGGHLSVKAKGGGVVCDQDLGAGAQLPPDAGVGPGRDAGSPASSDGGPATTAMPGGCGCAIGARVPPPSGALIALLLIAAIRIRRR